MRAAVHADLVTGGMLCMGARKRKLELCNTTMIMYVGGGGGSLGTLCQELAKLLAMLYGDL